MVANIPFVQVLILTAIAAPLFTCLFMWIYTVKLAASLKADLKGEILPISEKNRRCNAVFHGNMIREMGTANRRMAQALIIALLIISMLWLFAERYTQSNYVTLVWIVGLAVCAMYILAHITKIIVSTILPADVECYTALILAARKPCTSLLLTLIVYAAVYWIMIL